MKFDRVATAQLKILNTKTYEYLPTPINMQGLRMSFSITKSLAFSTNPCVFKVWNLSQNHRNDINNWGDKLTVSAGYAQEGGTSILYIGDTTAVSHNYEYPEIITTIECGDGDRYFNNQRVSYSFGANTSARTVIQEIANQMGLQLTEFSVSKDLSYAQGTRFIGMGKDALAKECAFLGLQFSIQNYELQIIPQKGTIEETPYEINENTGMQGVPQRFTYRRLELFRSLNQPTTGYKVNIALNPLILPGSRIILSSTHLNFRGLYRVETVRHEGDTFGFQWLTNLEVTELPVSNT